MRRKQNETREKIERKENIEGMQIENGQVRKPKRIKETHRNNANSISSNNNSIANISGNNN